MLRASTPSLPRRVALAGLLVTGLLLFARAAQGDVIIFTDGRVMNGTVEPIDDEWVRIVRADGEIRRRRADIEFVDEERTVADRLILGNRALTADPPDYQTGYRQFRLVERERPHDPDALLGIGRSLLGLGDLDRARSKVLEGVLFHPEHIGLSVFYAELLGRSGRYDDALGRLDDAAALLPSRAMQREIQRVRDLIREWRRQRGEGAGLDPPAPGPIDPELGNCREAAERALTLLAWAREERAEMFLSGPLEATPPQAQYNALETQRLRGNAAPYFNAVTTVTWRPLVDFAAWQRAASGNDHLREVTVYGWFYQLKAAYPQATITILVQAQDDRARPPVRRTIARATWVTDQVSIDWDPR